jgi:hypothetical protein
MFFVAAEGWIWVANKQLYGLTNNLARVTHGYFAQRDTYFGRMVLVQGLEHEGKGEEAGRKGG